MPLGGVTGSYSTPWLPIHVRVVTQVANLEEKVNLPTLVRLFTRL